MLTAAHISAFDEHGWGRVPGAIPDEHVQTVLDRVWNDLEQNHGDGRNTDGPEEA